MTTELVWESAAYSCCHLLCAMLSKDSRSMSQRCDSQAVPLLVCYVDLRLDPNSEKALSVFAVSPKNNLMTSP